ncbi:MAG: desulfoferrodoxin [Desulfobulbaceae bacterium]|nr:MAG: desulfoferrodoxin [Desulfobulbaceae bacterium]
MAQRLEVYKCNVCGNIVEVMTGGPGALVCCGQDMVQMSENTVDAAQEKHVPVATKVDGGWEVVVGSVAHPMEEKHLIEWIELNADGISYKEFLKPGDEPKAFFPVDADDVTVREFCNLHGLWKA